MKVFLDDIRNPIDCISYMHTRIGKDNPIYLEKWEIVRNYEEFISCIHDNMKDITHVSFDHDLADEHYHPSMFDEDMRIDPENLEGSYNHIANSFKEKTGYDCAKYLKWIYKECNEKLPIMYVHSMNPIGTQKIIDLFK
jgi:hypothetical protein